jgi:hypothetical protein
MAIATIPADLRNRTDLTVAQLNRVALLRKRRPVLEKQRDAAKDKADEIQADIDAGVKEEDEILRAPAPLFPKQ